MQTQDMAGNAKKCQAIQPLQSDDIYGKKMFQSTKIYQGARAVPIGSDTRGTTLSDARLLEMHDTL